MRRAVLVATALASWACEPTPAAPRTADGAGASVGWSAPAPESLVGTWVATRGEFQSNVTPGLKVELQSEEGQGTLQVVPDGRYALLLAGPNGPPTLELGASAVAPGVWTTIPEGGGPNEGTVFALDGTDGSGFTASASDVRLDLFGAGGLVSYSVRVTYRDVPPGRAEPGDTGAWIGAVWPSGRPPEPAILSLERAGDKLEGRLATPLSAGDDRVTGLVTGGELRLAVERGAAGAACAVRWDLTGRPTRMGTVGFRFEETGCADAATVGLGLVSRAIRPPDLDRPTGEHLINGTFDGGLAPWVLRPSHGTAATVDGAAGLGRDGSGALRVALPDAGSGASIAIEQEGLQIGAGEVLILSGWARTDRHLVRAAVAGCRIRGSGGTLLAARQVLIDGDWRRFFAVFQTPDPLAGAASGAVEVFVGLSDGPAGEVWLDDLSLQGFHAR